MPGSMILLATLKQPHVHLQGLAMGGLHSLIPKMLHRTIKELEGYLAAFSQSTLISLLISSYSKASGLLE